MPTRRLAAIMFTDIAGYTAMMQSDEAHALKIRNRHREVFERTHDAFNGKILQYYGDGTLSIFDSVVEAVKCGIEMQKAFQEEPRVPLRIGIHTGDIIYSDEEAIGDGVNIASRVESLAVPGSILVSDSVSEYLKNQSGIDLVSMGEFSFKNVERPMEVFAVAHENLVVPQPEKLEGKTAPRLSPENKSFVQRMPVWARFIGGFILFLILAPFIYAPLYNVFSGKAAGDEKSVHPSGSGTFVSIENQKRLLVITFENEDSTSENDWLGIGIPYALEMEWDQDPYIFNIFEESFSPGSFNEIISRAESSDLDLLVKGTYRLENDLFHIQVILQQIVNSKVIDTLRFEGRDLFSVLDEVSIEVKRRLGVPEEHISNIIDIPAGQYLTSSGEAYQRFCEAMILRNNGNFFPFGILEEVIKIDSTFAWANYYKATLHHYFQRGKQEGIKSISQAMRHRKRLPQTFEIQIQKLDYEIRGEPEKALQLSEVLTEMNPGNYVFWQNYIREAYNKSEYRKTIEAIEAYREITGDHQHHLFVEASCRFVIGEYDRALKNVKEYARESGNSEQGLLLEGQIYLAKKDYKTAESTFEKLSLLVPESKNSEAFIRHIHFMTDSAEKYRTPEWYDQFVGNYMVENFAEFKLVLKRDKDQLWFKAVNQKFSLIYPVSRYHYITTFPFELEWIPNENGVIDRMRAKENNYPYIVLKIDSSLQKGIDLFSASKFEEALPILRKSVADHPDFLFINHMIRHIDFSKQPEYAEQVKKYSEMTGNYTFQSSVVEITLKEGNPYMSLHGLGISPEPFPVYEMEKDTFFNLCTLHAKITLVRKNGKIIALKPTGLGKDGMILERVKN